MDANWLSVRREAVRWFAALTPLVVAGLLYLLRGVLGNSAAALILVLVVVAVAATGDRIAGIIAGLSAAVGFDFFLTSPYLQFRIDSAEDIELTVLLLLVALAVNELALWGQRQSATAGEQAAFVRGILESSDLAAGSAGAADGLERVSDSIKRILGAERVSYENGTPDASSAVIARDGAVRWHGADLDVQTDGLPTDRYCVIPITQRGADVGYFRITAASSTVRPTAQQLRVAVLLAGQWTLRADAPRDPSTGTARRKP